jgi:phage gpG-like protein
MITVEVVGDHELVARLDAMPGRVHDGLARAVTRLRLELQRKVQSEKLSGSPLEVRTGTLRSSINTQVTDTLTEVAASVGTNLRYAAAQEFGFRGTVSVKAHMRQIKEAFGRSIRPKTIEIRAHTMRMNLPERSFLRSALAEMQPAIEDELEEAVARAIRQ